MIREAIQSDIPAIVALGRDFLLNGPYRDQLEDNPEYSSRLAMDVLQEKGKIVVLENDGEIDGVLGFIVFPHYFSGELTAGELIWYVKPEARPGGDAMKLMWKAEEIARELGVKRMQFTSPTADVSRIYERFGYKQVETTFQKVL